MQALTKMDEFSRGPVSRNKVTRPGVCIPKHFFASSRLDRRDAMSMEV